MRTARFSWVLLPLALAAHAVASPQPRGTAESEVAAPARPIVATIHLRSGDSIGVSYVGPWALNAVRYFTPDGQPGYLSTHQIERIVAPTGADLTRPVLEERASLSVPGGPRPPSMSSWLVSPFRYRSTRGRAYTVLELSAVQSDGEVTRSGRGTIFTAGIGGMASLSRSWALGGVVFMSTGDRDYRAAAVGARVRRYLGDRLSLELTGGVFSGSGDHWSTRGTPRFGEGAVTFADAISIVGRVESATWETELRTFTPTGYVYQDAREHVTTWRTGVRLGPSPRWLSIPAFVVGSAAFVFRPVSTQTNP